MDDILTALNTLAENRPKIIESLKDTTEYNFYRLNLDKVETLDDCKKILKFLCDRAIKPLPEGFQYNGFDEVEKYFTR